MCLLERISRAHTRNTIVVLRMNALIKPLFLNYAAPKFQNWYFNANSKMHITA